MTAVVYLQPGNPVTWFELCARADYTDCTWVQDTKVTPPSYGNEPAWLTEEISHGSGSAFSTTYRAVHYAYAQAIESSGRIVQLNNVNSQPWYWGPYPSSGYQLLAPGTQQSSSAFDVCPGYWTAGHPAPTTCPGS